MKTILVALILTLPVIGLADDQRAIRIQTDQIQSLELFVKEKRIALQIHFERPPSDLIRHDRELQAEKKTKEEIPPEVISYKLLVDDTLFTDSALPIFYTHEKNGYIEIRYHTLDKAVSDLKELTKDKT